MGIHVSALTPIGLLFCGVSYNVCYYMIELLSAVHVLVWLDLQCTHRHTDTSQIDIDSYDYIL